MFTIVLDYNDTRDLGTMKLLSINVGLPREIEWKEKTVRTSIFKEPVQGRVRVAQLNLEGDRSLTCPCMQESIKPFTRIHRSTSHHGARNFLE